MLASLLAGALCAPLVIPPGSAASSDTYEALLAEYEQALAEVPIAWEFRDGFVHPVAALYERFEALALDGEPRAALWCSVQHGSDELMEVEPQAEPASFLSTVFADSAAQVDWVVALVELERRRRGIEEERARAWCGALFEHADAEVRAGALCALAGVISNGGRTRDDDLLAEAQALWGRALEEEPGTEAAVRAGRELLAPIEKAYRKELRSFDRGRRDEPPAPEFAPQVLALAERGAGYADLWLIDELYRPSADAAGLQRSGLRLARNHRGHELAATLAAGLSEMALSVGLEAVLPIGEELLGDEEAVGELRGRLAVGVAELLARFGDDAQLERARTLVLESGLERVTEMLFVEDVDALLFQWRFMSIGGTPPTFVAEDIDGQPVDTSALAGQVLVLAFLYEGAGTRDGADFVAATLEGLEQEELHVVGICDAIDWGPEEVQAAREAQAAADWRLVVDIDDRPLKHLFHVYVRPTYVVIGRDGRIAAKWEALVSPPKQDRQELLRGLLEQAH